MTLAVLFEAPSATKEQYDAVMADLEASGDIGPDGMSYHLAAFDERGLFVVDVWHDESKIDAFTKVLEPIIAKHITGEVRVRPMPVHRILVPANA